MIAGKTKSILLWYIDHINEYVRSIYSCTRQGAMPDPKDVGTALQLSSELRDAIRSLHSGRDKTLNPRGTSGPRLQFGDTTDG